MIFRTPMGILDPKKISRRLSNTVLSPVTSSNAVATYGRKFQDTRRVRIAVKRRKSAPNWVDILSSSSSFLEGDWIAWRSSRSIEEQEWPHTRAIKSTCQSILRYLVSNIPCPWLISSPVNSSSKRTVAFLGGLRPFARSMNCLKSEPPNTLREGVQEERH